MTNSHLTVEQVADFLSSVYQDGPSDPFVEQHLHHCERCRALLEEQTVAVAALAAACDQPLELFLGSSHSDGEPESLELVGVGVAEAASASAESSGLAGVLDLSPRPTPPQHVLGPERAERSAAFPVEYALGTVPVVHIGARRLSRRRIKLGHLSRICVALLAAGIACWFCVPKPAASRAASLGFAFPPADAALLATTYYTGGYSPATRAFGHEQGHAMIAPREHPVLWVGPLSDVGSVPLFSDSARRGSSEPVQLSGTALREQVLPYLDFRDQVRVFQTILADQGMYPIGRIDGVLGQQTVAAIRAFQQNENVSELGSILTVDGKLGAKTRKRLLDKLDARTVAIVESSAG